MAINFILASKQMVPYLLKGIDTRGVHYRAVCISTYPTSLLFTPHNYITLPVRPMTWLDTNTGIIKYVIVVF